MQSDMHYHGTYCMARAAGLSRDAAHVAASAAQYVDDNVERAPLPFKDGARLMRSPTAHHLGDEISNINPDDQRDVWVPFHFLPGNEAGTGGDNDYTERLKCRMNSEPARAMVDKVLETIGGDTLGLERLGITAHVYADTFSHFGFSGVSSRRNTVDGRSFRFPGIEPDLAEHLQGKLKGFAARFAKETKALANIKSWVAETVTLGLGHGAVATYPDLPYLRWGFDYTYPTRVSEERDNSATFLAACRALYDLFAQAVKERPDFGDGTQRPFAEIEATVKDVLATQGDGTKRSQAWQQAAQSGKLFTVAEDIPAYLGDEWTRWLDTTGKTVDSDSALEHPACRFHLAANAHRSWVLHELLPSRSLLVA